MFFPKLKLSLAKIVNLRFSVYFPYREIILIQNFFPRNVLLLLPKWELPKLIIRHNIGPISAANSELLLLGQCSRLHRSSAGPTMAAFIDCLNSPAFSRNLAQYRPYTKPIVTFTVARVGARISRQVQTGVIISATARYWQPIIGTFLPKLGQCWAVSNFALG